VKRVHYVGFKTSRDHSSKSWPFSYSSLENSCIAKANRRHYVTVLPLCELISGECKAADLVKRAGIGLSPVIAL
jgi:hypothetical protein